MGLSCVLLIDIFPAGSERVCPRIVQAGLISSWWFQGPGNIFCDEFIRSRVKSRCRNYKACSQKSMPSHDVFCVIPGISIINSEQT